MQLTVMINNSVMAYSFPTGIFVLIIVIDSCSTSTTYPHYFWTVPAYFHPCYQPEPDLTLIYFSHVGMVLCHNMDSEEPARDIAGKSYLNSGMENVALLLIPKL